MIWIQEYFMIMPSDSHGNLAVIFLFEIRKLNEAVTVSLEIMLRHNIQ